MLVELDCNMWRIVSSPLVCKWERQKLETLLDIIYIERCAINYTHVFTLADSLGVFWDTCLCRLPSICRWMEFCLSSSAHWTNQLHLEKLSSNLSFSKVANFTVSCCHVENNSRRVQQENRSRLQLLLTDFFILFVWLCCKQKHQLLLFLMKWLLWECLL